MPEMAETMLSHTASPTPSFFGVRKTHRNICKNTITKIYFSLSFISTHCNTQFLQQSHRNIKTFASEYDSFLQQTQNKGENTSHFDGSKASIGEDNKSQKRLSKSEELLQNLKRYGASGVLSYGLLNTAYYLGTFLFVWFYVAPAPGGLGYVAAAQRFLKIMAMVWAGSQVTKLLRAGGALALAPLVDQGLSWFTAAFRFQSRGKAFAAIVSACVAIACLFFAGITFLWA